MSFQIILEIAETSFERMIAMREHAIYMISSTGVLFALSSDKYAKGMASFCIKKTGLKGDPISLHSCASHVGVLMPGGKAFLWGSNAGFQLAQPLPDFYSTWVEVKGPKTINPLE